MKIVKYGDPVLRKKAAKITKIDEHVVKLAESMTAVLHAAKGVGLAANQVGVQEKLCVIDTGRGDKKGEVLCLINPEVTASEGSAVFEEGCLSFPEIFAEIDRPAKVTVSFKDLKGKDKEVTAEGILARVLQHEIDHLNGVLFVDRMSRIKHMLLSKRLKALEKETRGK